MAVKKTINANKEVVSDSDNQRVALTPILKATNQTKRSNVTTSPRASKQNSSGRKNYFEDYVDAATPTYEQAVQNVTNIGSDTPSYGTATGTNVAADNYIRSERDKAAKRALTNIGSYEDGVVDKLASYYNVSNPRFAANLYTQDVPQGVLPILYDDSNTTMAVTPEMDKIIRDAAAGYEYDINGNGKNNYGLMTGTPYQPGTYSPTNAFLNRDWDITQRRNPYIPRSERNTYHTVIGYG